MEKIRISANQARIEISTTLVLIISLSAIFSVAYASGVQSSNPGYAPGVPEDAIQHNRTDTTPTGQMEQVTARETHVFSYRNLTLVLNCTRNCELIVTTDPAVKPKVLSLSIDPNQTITLAINITGVPPSGETVMERTLNFYMGIEPNATLELTAQIRLHINQTELTQELNREVNVSRLTWMYWNKTELEWSPVPSWIDQNKYLLCNTTHFSIWTVAEVSPESLTTPTPPTSDSTESLGIAVTLVGLGGAVIIVIVLAAVLFGYRKRKA